MVDDYDENDYNVPIEILGVTKTINESNPHKLDKYVSIIKFRNYPIYGSQFHFEKL